MSELSPSRYWGDAWDAPVCEGAIQSSGYPLGEPCLYCDEKIVEGEAGTFTTELTLLGPVVHPVHKECSLRMVLGGIGHHLDHARHCIEQGDPDGGRSYRESALLVWKLYVG